MALTILLTGFGPFPGAPSNPTGVLVQRLAYLRRPALADVRLVPHVFSTSYRAVDSDLPHLLADLKPDGVADVRAFRKGVVPAGRDPRA